MSLDTLSRWAGYADLALASHRARSASTPELAEIASKHLVARMGRLRGLPQKMGQILSMTTDVERAETFAPLQQSSDPLPWKVVRPILEARWNQPIKKVLAEVDEHGLAASLGQVHRAVLTSGEQVAVKVQYPGMRSAIESDLGALGWLTLPVGGLARGFQLEDYRKMLLDDLSHELDYTAEARTQQRFAEVYASDPLVRVPRVFDSLTSGDVLVTSWESGSTIDEAVRWPHDVRRKLSIAMVRWFFTGILQRELMHADLHPGNVRFTNRASGPQMLLYDFGCVARFTRTEQQTIAALLLSTLRREGSPWSLLLELGFSEEKLTPLAHKLPAVLSLIAEPLTAEYPFVFAQWNLSSRMSDVLGDDRWNFRMAGPAALVMLLRAWHGLLYYLERLDAPIAWKPIVMPILEAAARDYRPASSTPTVTRRCDFGTLSKWLKLRVKERESVKVQLTMSASAIDDLEQLIDEPLRRKIEAQGTSLAQLATEVRQRQYRPGSVFSLIDGQREIDVWLE